MPEAEPKRAVHCVKTGCEMDGLDEVPSGNHPLGQKIRGNVSKEAWRMRVEQTKMIMNECRLNPGAREAQQFLLKQWRSTFSAKARRHPTRCRRRVGLRFDSRRMPELRRVFTGSCCRLSEGVSHEPT